MKEYIDIFELTPEAEKLASIFQDALNEKMIKIDGSILYEEFGIIKHRTRSGEYVFTHKDDKPGVYFYKDID